MFGDIHRWTIASTTTSRRAFGLTSYIRPSEGAVGILSAPVDLCFGSRCRESSRDI